MSDTKTGMSRRSGRAAAGPIVTAVSTRLVVQPREAVQLRGEDLQVVPLGSWSRGTPIAATAPCAPARPFLASRWISAT